MSTENLLSIYIPTFNRSKILYRQLSILFSYLNNTKFSHLIELIVSDNASEDDTMEVCEFFDISKKDLQFKYHRNKSNIGPFGNFFQSTTLCNSKYIWILGDDDIVLTIQMDKLVSLIINELNDEIILLNTVFDKNDIVTGRYCVNETFKNFEITSLGHISRLIIKASHLKNNLDKIQNRPVFYIWPMVMIFFNNNPNVYFYSEPLLYPTKDGGMEIWKDKTAFPRLIEFIDYIEMLGLNDIEKNNLYKMNFISKKFIIKKIVASSILVPKSIEYEKLIPVLDYFKIKYNPIVLLMRILRSNFGYPILVSLRYFTMKFR